jgi:glutathione S-transferase
MITLYTFGPGFGLPDPSPFVTKAEMLLKLAGLAYRTDTNGYKRAPKGKLPYIEDDGTLIADSTFIRWHIEKKYGIDFDRGLSAAERGVAWAVEKLLEDNLYWALVHARWMDDANFARGPATFFQSVPWSLRPLVQAMIRRKVGKDLKSQGLGRHSPQEIAALAVKGVESVAAILGDKPYLMGAQPCGADATLFAFASGTLCPLFDTPIRSAAEARPNLVAYVERMRGQYFPDFTPKV